MTQCPKCGSTRIGATYPIVAQWTTKDGTKRTDAKAVEYCLACLHGLKR